MDDLWKKEHRLMNGRWIALSDLEKEFLLSCPKTSVRYDDAFIFCTDTQDDSEHDGKFGFLLDREKDIVYGSGCNSYSVLATGGTLDIMNKFKKIESLSGRKIKYFDAGRWHVLALTEDGKVYSWGGNNCGQLGIGEHGMSCAVLPQLVKFDKGVKIKSIAAFNEASWAISEDGQLYAFGWNGHGQLCKGNVDKGEYQLTPRLVDMGDIEPIESIHGARYAAFIRTSTNRLYTWGSNRCGDCGCDSEDTCISRPVLVDFDYENDSIERFVAAECIFAILSKKGEIYIWGRFYPRIRKPTRLELDDKKKIIGMFSSGWHLVFLFDDMTAALYFQDDSHLKPILVPIEKVGKEIFSTERIKLWLKSEQVFTVGERNPIFGDASDLFDKKEFADVKFCFNSEVDGISIVKTLLGHKAILATRSTVFQAKLSDEWKEKDILIESYCYEAYKAFLFYLYSGSVQGSRLDVPQLVELYDLGEEHQDQFLMSRAIKYLGLRLESITQYEELINLYETTKDKSPEIGQTIIKRIFKAITHENYMEIAQFAYSIKHDDLLNDAARFILENRKELLWGIDLSELEPMFAQALITAVLKA